MAKDAPEYWPFPVLPPESRTEEHWEEIRFFEKAFEAGFRPRSVCGMEIEAERDGRSIWMSPRGAEGRPRRRRWEVMLFEGDRRHAAVWVNSFSCGSAAVFAWLRGESAEAALAAAGDSVIRGGLDATPAGAAG